MGDDAVAQHRIRALGLDLRQRAGKLSGGQRSQLALTLAMGKRPEFLVLDEPVSSLDPLARRTFLADVMELMADHRPTVILSSHLLSDVERVCDHLILMAEGQVQLAGPVDDLLAPMAKRSIAAHHQRRPDRRGSRGRARPPPAHPARSRRPSIDASKRNSASAAQTP